MTLRDQLQRTLGSAYTLERELGGGGMSRVFLAEDTALGRKIVVKILPPELTAGVNVERFNREILLAAKLQHPHIVPVLAAGAMDGLPWFTMPFVEGESLRARLERGTALSITEAVGMLRDVAKALAYAHEHGIVHRDIKPDNVLLTGGSATVADFGIAKAISASRAEGGNQTLTQVGTSIGTPTYMSPEQASGDPETDHRTDLYSFGCLAYEVLAGRPPFIEKSPRKLLAAHMGERPQSIVELRPDIPVALAELVMACLEKEADARPQQARDLVRVLETVTTGSGHQTAAPAVLLAGAGMLQRALMIYALSFGAVAIVAKAAIVGIGLPEWVFAGALIVMALGLPVILWTGYVHRVTRKAFSATPTFTPGGTPSLVQGTMATIALKASPHMSWRQTARGGYIAMGVFVALIVAFMVLRAMGIGPEGSLFAAGALNASDRIVMTHFTVSGADSSLGRVVSDAVRAGLSQSRVLNVLSQSEVADGMRRMQRAANDRVDLPTAQALALRNGAKAVVDGDVTQVGASYIVSVRLVTADSARELASYRGTANGPGEVITVADELSRKLRARAGESLRSVNASRPLERAATASLDALRKYSEGAWANDVDGDYGRAIRLLKEAVAIDTLFTEAWRKLGVALTNAGMPQTQSDSALRRAFALRDRLPDDQRDFLEGYFYSSGPGYDRARGAQVYERMLARGDSAGVLNNLGNTLRDRREFARAESLFAAAARKIAGPSLALGNLYFTKFVRGDITGMDSIATTLKGVRGAEPFLAGYVADRAQLLGDAVALRAGLEARARVRDPSDPTGYLRLRGGLEGIEGRLRTAQNSIIEAQRADSIAGRSPYGVTRAIERLARLYANGGDVTATAEEAERLLAPAAIASVPVIDRPYVAASEALALAGRPAAAKALLGRLRSEMRDDTARLRSVRPNVQRAEAAIAEAEGRWTDAARDYRLGDQSPDGPTDLCYACLFMRLTVLFARAGMADSAIAQYEAYGGSEFGSRERTGPDLFVSTPVIASIARMYDQRGDTARAVLHYRDFIERWKNADAELQPQVSAARKRLAELTPVERPRR